MRLIILVILILAMLASGQEFAPIVNQSANQMQAWADSLAESIIYTPLAKAARSQGDAAFEVMTGESGDVRALYGPPVLLESARTSLLIWARKQRTTNNEWLVKIHYILAEPHVSKAEVPIRNRVARFLRGVFGVPLVRTEWTCETRTQPWAALSDRTIEIWLAAEVGCLMV